MARDVTCPWLGIPSWSFCPAAIRSQWAQRDPAFGLISLDGEKLVWQESAIADMRGKLRSNFTVSNDGSSVRFGLGIGDESPVLFDLAAGRLTDQPQPAAGLAEPDTTSLQLSDWMNNYRAQARRQAAGT